MRVRDLRAVLNNLGVEWDNVEVELTVTNPVTQRHWNVTGVQIQEKCPVCTQGTEKRLLLAVNQAS